MRVKVCLLDEAESKETALTENVSGHGARVVLERKLQPGKQVLLASPNEDVRSPGMVVYCQRVIGNKFAVGLELSTRVEPWAKAY